MKDKKGLEVYLPFLAILSIIVFTWTAYTISSVSHEEEIFKAGETSKHLIQLYDEAEKALFYIEESTKLAEKETYNTICENAGYLKEECKTEKLLNGQTFTDWNSCPKLDPQNKYQEQFKSNLKFYFKNYISFYQESHDGFTDSYSKLINNLEIETIKEGEINFKEVNYYLEKQKNSTYNVKPISKLNIPDLTEFQNLYTKLTLCNDIPSCTIKLPEYHLSGQGTKIYIRSQNKDCQIQIVIDKSKPLQGRITSFS